MFKSTEKVTRYALGIVLSFVALNAFGGGYYGIAGAEGIPIEWLKGSPFHSYLIPSFFLFMVVGGSSLFAAMAVFCGWRIARSAALVCGLIILLWIIVQVVIIGYQSWMQPATASAALVILFLTWKLSSHDN